MIKYLIAKCAMPNVESVIGLLVFEKEFTGFEFDVGYSIEYFNDIIQKFGEGPYRERGYNSMPFKHPYKNFSYRQIISHINSYITKYNYYEGGDFNYYCTSIIIIQSIEINPIDLPKHIIPRLAARSSTLI